ncbi:serine threonine protein kinase [Stylonychia lemnae]|uniref:Serine threonine protein kinase n=1 Tax=Stylonychia lemnae TaxID=5949 RepID=A0A077ZWB6_STYLE|nr:serine threonine protein kinase [Stylonychia lemnae]|eukprot:CDW74164.1 serine threonine protein kinase [Stylonychia lemnae]
MQCHKSQLFVDNQEKISKIEKSLKFLTIAKVTIINRKEQQNNHENLHQKTCKIFHHQKFLHLQEIQSGWHLTLNIDLGYAKLISKLNSDSKSFDDQFAIEKNDSLIIFEKCEKNYINTEENLDLMNSHFAKSLIGILDQNCVWDFNAEEFDFRGKLGCGSQAKVYLVHTKQQNQIRETCPKYALKIIEKSEESKLKQIAILREIKIQRKLRNEDHIIQMHRVYEDQRNIYLLLDYIKGCDIRQLIRQKVVVNESESRVIIYQVLQCLQSLCLQNIIHKDITPQNILISEQNGNSSKPHQKVYLADFGLAIQLNENKQQQFNICGTPGYIAPEILRSNNHNLKNDLFGVGCVLFKMLRGKNLFQGQNGREIIKTNAYCKTELILENQLRLYSCDLREFLVQILNPSVDERISLSEALEHKWFKRLNKYKDLGMYLPKNNDQRSVQVNRNYEIFCHQRLCVTQNNENQQEKTNNSKFDQIYDSQQLNQHQQERNLTNKFNSQNDDKNIAMKHSHGLQSTIYDGKQKILPITSIQDSEQMDSLFNPQKNLAVNQGQDIKSNENVLLVPKEELKLNQGLKSDDIGQLIKENNEEEFNRFEISMAELDIEIDMRYFQSIMSDKQMNKINICQKFRQFF